VDRNLVLGILVLIVCGPMLLAFGLWPARRTRHRSGLELERAQWRRLWLPLVPAALTLSVLIGWALQEPNQTDELLRDEAGFMAAVFATVWLRALVRSLIALRGPLQLHAGTVGLFSPRIVLSRELASRLDEHALAAAREHEAAHVRHRDPLRIWLAQLATDLQWPWPSAKRRLRAWREALELVRDDEARAHGVDGADLAAAVLAAAQLGRARVGYAGAGLADEGEALERRIKRLLAPLQPSSTWRLTVVLPMVLLGALVSAGLFGLLHGDLFVRALPGVLD